MTDPRLNYRFSNRPLKRSAYENFVAYLEYLSSVQDENRKQRRCIVRIVTVNGANGSISAAAGWETYCRAAPREMQRRTVGVMHE